MSKSRVRRIEVLRDRAIFLQNRIDERGDEHNASGFDRAEMRALFWAIPILEGHVEANRVLHEQLKDEKGERD